MIVVVGQARTACQTLLSSLISTLYYSVNLTASSSPNASNLVAGTSSRANPSTCLHIASDAGIRKFAKCRSSVSHETNKCSSGMCWFFATR
ncbi:hypothetical protein CsSME_00046999 [Camellia sinensis var. sinensis]